MVPGREMRVLSQKLFFSCMPSLPLSRPALLPLFRRVGTVAAEWDGPAARVSTTKFIVDDRSILPRRRRLGPNRCGHRDAPTGRCSSERREGREKPRRGQHHRWVDFVQDQIESRAHPENCPRVQKGHRRLFFLGGSDKTQKIQLKSPPKK